MNVSFIQEKLWMWIAKYIIYTWNQTNVDYILQIIEEGSQSASDESLYKSLTILLYIPQELKLLVGNKDLSMFAKTRLIYDWHKLYDFVCKILNLKDIKEEIVKATFKMLEEWIITSDMFYKHEEIQSLIFNALDSKWFQDVKEIVSTVITKSPNANLFQNANLDAILKDINLIVQQRIQGLTSTLKLNTIQANEQRFLDSLVDFILKSKQNFLSEIEDIESEFWSNFSDLAIELFQIFDVLIFEDSERAVNIFEIIILILSHKSRSISLQAIEFFGSFKETIAIIKTKHSDLEFYLEPYFEATKIVLEKSKKKLFEKNDDGEFVEPEDSDNDKQEDVGHYREYAADLFFNTYHMWDLLHWPDKKIIFEQILWESFSLENLNQKEQSQYIEASIFAAKSTFEAVELPDDKLLEKIWSWILNMGYISEPTVFHTSLLFFNEWATYLTYNKSIIMLTIEYIKSGFNIFSSISWIQGSIFKCLVEIWQYMTIWPKSDDECEIKTDKQIIDVQNAFEAILDFLKENAASIEKDNWFSAMESIWNVWSILPEEEVPGTINQILKIATDVYPKLEFSDFGHRLILIKSLLMICGAVKALSALHENIIKETLHPIIDSLIDKISEAHRFYANDKEVCLTIWNFYSKWIKWLNTSYSKFFTKTLFSWFEAFAANKENSKWIEVWSLAIAQVGNTEEVDNTIKENFSKLAEIVLEKIDTTKDIDVIRYFASLLCQIWKKLSPSWIINYIEFKSIIKLFWEYCMNKTDNESGEEVIFFLHELICNSELEVQRVIMEYIKDIGIVLIVSLPNMKSVVSQIFAKLLTKIFLDYQEIMQEWCEIAFQHPKFADISDNIKVNFVKFLIGFKNHSSLFKHTIIIFQSIMKGMSNEQEFIGLELKLNQIQDKSDTVEID